MNDNATTAGEDLLYEVRDGVARITFNRPQARNALTFAMYERMAQICEAADADKSIKAVILSGAGGKAFASGADVSKFADERQEAAALAHYQAVTAQAYRTLQALPMPTIAMVRGWCIGGGTALAVCCDLRVCNEQAKFGVPAARLGLGYGIERAKPLVDLIGPAYAKEMFFTGRQFDAREAQAMGLVNRVVADEQIESAVQELARGIADNAPLTVRAAKLVVGEVLKDAADRDVAAADRAVAACFASSDYKEGQAAFMAKRRPRFTGR